MANKVYLQELSRKFLQRHIHQENLLLLQVREAVTADSMAPPNAETQNSSTGSWLTETSIDGKGVRV